MKKRGVILFTVLLALLLAMPLIGLAADEHVHDGITFQPGTVLRVYRLRKEIII